METESHWQECEWFMHKGRHGVTASWSIKEARDQNFSQFGYTVNEVVPWTLAIIIGCYIAWALSPLGWSKATHHLCNFLTLMVLLVNMPLAKVLPVILNNAMINLMRLSRSEVWPNAYVGYTCILGMWSYFCRLWENPIALNKVH